MALSTVMDLDAGATDEVVVSVEWILADLPADASLALRFPGLRTVRPIEQSIKGLARIERPRLFAAVGYVFTIAWDALARLLGLRKQRALVFRPTRYIAVRGSPVVLHGVVLKPGSRAAVRMDVDWKSPPRGAVHTVQIVQRRDDAVVGGSTFRLLGPALAPLGTPQPVPEEDRDEVREEGEQKESRLPQLVIAWNRPNERP